MGRKKPEKASEMLDSLHDFLIGPAPDFKTMSAEKVSQYLTKNKLDAGAVVKAAQSALNEAQGQIELAAAREKRLRIEREPPNVRPRPSLRESLLEQIRTIAGSSMAAVYARKFEDAPDADLRSLMEDFEFLEQLDLDDDEQ